MKFIKFVPSLLFIFGSLILAYPYVATTYNESVQSKIVLKDTNAAKDLSDNQLTDEVEKVKQYDDNLVGQPLHDPFAQGAGYVTQSKEYQGVLNISGDGVMGSLEIPSIQLELPIYHGVDNESISKGVGHIPYTSTPYGGKGRHSFLSSHRGLPDAKLFTDLDQLKKGDFACINVLNESHWYKVIKIEVIKPEEFVATRPDPDKDLLTLVTCTPLSVNTHRLLVTLERTSAPVNLDKLKISRKHSISTYYLWAFMAAHLILIAALVNIIRILRKR